MASTRTSALLLATLLALPLASSTTSWAAPAKGKAAADDFGAMAKNAKVIHGGDGVSALFWSQEASCANRKSDLLRRQCEQVKAQRRADVADQTYLVEAGSSALDLSTEAGALGKDGKKEPTKVTLTLRACVACDDQDGAIILGSGKHTVKGKKVEAAELATSTRSFDRPELAEHWQTYVASRLRAQFIVKLPARVDKFKAGGRDAYKVEVLGYRLYDPCLGEVLSADPTSQRAPQDAKTCEGTPPPPEEEKVVVKTPEVQHPDRLNTQQITEAMAEVTAQAKVCHEAYGIDGLATFKLVIGGNGKLKKAEQTGDFLGTPTGICLDKAIQLAKFPKSKKKETPVTYPMMLQ